MSNRKRTRLHVLHREQNPTRIEQFWRLRAVLATFPDTLCQLVLDYLSFCGDCSSATEWLLVCTLCKRSKCVKCACLSDCWQFLVSPQGRHEIQLRCCSKSPRHSLESSVQRLLQMCQMETVENVLAEKVHCWYVIASLPSCIWAMEGTKDLENVEGELNNDDIILPRCCDSNCRFPAVYGSPPFKWRCIHHSALTNSSLTKLALWPVEKVRRVHRSIQVTFLWPSPVR
jgi:hypothetical protein